MGRYDHVHPCPECYERAPCTMPQCGTELDDDGVARGGHCVCDACAASLKTHRERDLLGELADAQREADALRDRVRALEAERDAALAMARGWDQAIADTSDALVALGAERDRLRAALREYGRHDDLCPTTVRFGRCTCGLAAALGEGGE